MKSTESKLATLVTVGVVLSASAAQAHFQLVWFDGMNRDPNQELEMAMVFTHVFPGGPTMAMEQPNAFYVVHQGGEKEAERTDLMPYLKEIEWAGSDEDNSAAWKAPPYSD